MGKQNLTELIEKPRGRRSLCIKAKPLVACRVSTRQELAAKVEATRNYGVFIASLDRCTSPEQRKLRIAIYELNQQCECGS